MRSISNMQELQEAIRELELVQSQRKKELLHQIDITKQSFKPMNIIKSTLKDFTKDTDTRNSIIQSAASIGLGFLTKNLVSWKSASTAKNFIGGLLESGVKSVSNSGTAKAYATAIFKNLFGKKKKANASDETTFS